jgi:archaellum biogenesis ATPase FlaH
MWNYRITYRPSDIEQGYGIREVFYNDNGEPVSYTADSIEPYGESKEELISDLAYMIQAISQEVVDLDELDAIFETKNNSNTKEDLQEALDILNKSIDND